MLEQGLVFKASGQKICYVAPATLAVYVMNAIAGVRATRDDAYSFKMMDLPEPRLGDLTDQDMDVMRETENAELFGQWITIPGLAFSRETL